MTHNNIETLEKTSVGITFRVIACLFVIGLWLSFSGNIAGVDFASPPIVDESVAFDKDTDFPSDGAFTIALSAPLNPPQTPSIYRCASNRTKPASRYFATYSATGPPNA